MAKERVIDSADLHTVIVGFQCVLWPHNRAQIITEQAPACRSTARLNSAASQCRGRRSSSRADVLTPQKKLLHFTGVLPPTWLSFHSRFSAITSDCGTFLKRFPVRLSHPSAQACDQQRLTVSRPLLPSSPAVSCCKGWCRSYVHKSGCGAKVCWGFDLLLLELFTVLLT